MAACVLVRTGQLRLTHWFGRRERRDARPSFSGGESPGGETQGCRNPKACGLPSSFLHNHKPTNCYTISV